MKIITLLLLFTISGCVLRSESNEKHRLEFTFKIIDIDSMNGIIKLKAFIINNTDSSQEYILPVCSYSDYFISNDLRFKILTDTCYSNKFVCYILEPKKSVGMSINIKTDSRGIYSNNSFRLGFYRIKANSEKHKKNNIFINPNEESDYYNTVENYMRTLHSQKPIWSNWIYLSNIKRQK